ncbi:putative zeta-carotene desaturase, chloroplastic/chromoplastic-like [Capsicum annuum]|nr:putative zeta-carotene desaturase, chloroplastic/chromoplastic-like [Capsicum annuum]
MMAAAPFLLESNLKWNPLFYTPNPIQYNRFLHHQKLTPSKLSRPTKLTVKCFTNNRKNVNFNDKNGSEMKEKENPFDVIVKSVMKALKALQKPAVAAVLVGLLLMYDPNSALAASGGRIGGKSFSSSSRSSSSSRGYTMRRSEPSFGYSVPYYAPSPFGFGGGGVYVGPAVGFGSSAFLVMMGFAAFVLVSGFLSDRSEGGVLTATDKTSVLKLQGSEMKEKENPFDIIVKSVMKALKALQKPSVAAVLVGLLLMYDPNSALAASGGRIGGKSFSSSSRSSSLSRGYTMRRSEPSFGYSVPYYAPSPFGFGGGGVYVGPAVGFGSSAFLVMMGFAAFVLVSGFLLIASRSCATAIYKTSVLKL